ncbi:MULTISPECIES: hypothetical protein [unclassified Streptomyces]|uniref:hypothetical protein n=1 Tax=unclassified Streptomyces TaxID=2593676 RepID=UPI00352C2CB4
MLLAAAPDGRYVAVKQVHAELAEDEGFRARFRREVDASRRVAGGYTAAVIDADPDAKTPWLASQVRGPGRGDRHGHRRASGPAAGGARTARPASAPAPEPEQEELAALGGPPGGGGRGGVRAERARGAGAGSAGRGGRVPEPADLCRGGREAAAAGPEGRKDGYQDLPERAFTHCAWLPAYDAVTEREPAPHAIVEWRLEPSGRTPGSGTRAQRLGFGSGREEIALGAGDAAYWSAPEAAETCRLHVRDGDLVVRVALGGAEHPGATCESEAKEIARAALAAVPRRT